jgi:hypothetical protein
VSLVWPDGERTVVLAGPVVGLGPAGPATQRPFRVREVVAQQPPVDPRTAAGAAAGGRHPVVGGPFPNVSVAGPNRAAVPGDTLRGPLPNLRPPRGLAR